MVTQLKSSYFKSPGPKLSIIQVNKAVNKINYIKLRKILGPAINDFK